MNRIRKGMLICALLAAVIAADTLLTLRFSAKRSIGAAAPMVEPVNEPDALEEFRTQREQLHAQAVAQLNEIIHGEGGSEEIVAAAQRQLIERIHRRDQESTLEGILRARGFEDALVTVSERSVNVLLRAESVNQQQSAVVLELVMRETGVSGGNVKIIPVK